MSSLSHIQTAAMDSTYSSFDMTFLLGETCLSGVRLQP